MCGFLCSLFFLLCFVGALYSRWAGRKRLSPIAGKCVLVTGCSTGFGRALARRLDGLGVRVFATCRTEASAAALRAETSDRLKVVMMDVRDTASIERAYQLISQQLPSEGNSMIIYGSWPLVRRFRPPVAGVGTAVA